MCRGLLPGPKHLSLHSIVREGQNGPASVICVHGDDAVNGEVSRLIVAAGSDDYGKGRSGKKCGCDFLLHSALFCLNGAITSGKKQLVVPVYRGNDRRLYRHEGVRFIYSVFVK